MGWHLSPGRGCCGGSGSPYCAGQRQSAASRCLGVRAAGAHSALLPLQDLGSPRFPGCAMEARMQGLKTTTVAGQCLTRWKIVGILEIVAALSPLGRVRLAQILCAHRGCRTSRGPNRIQLASNCWSGSGSKRGRPSGMTARARAAPRPRPGSSIRRLRSRARWRRYGHRGLSWSRPSRPSQPAPH